MKMNSFKNGQEPQRIEQPTEKPKLKIVTTETTCLDSLTTEQIIGRPAHQFHKLKPPHFDANGEREIKHGILGEWLNKLTKK
jgi:hypothetical protein